MLGFCLKLCDFGIKFDFSIIKWNYESLTEKIDHFAVYGQKKLFPLCPWMWIRYLVAHIKNSPIPKFHQKLGLRFWETWSFLNHGHALGPSPLTTFDKFEIEFFPIQINRRFWKLFIKVWAILKFLAQTAGSQLPGTYFIFRSNISIYLSPHF